MTNVSSLRNPHGIYHPGAARSSANTKRRAKKAHDFTSGMADQVCQKKLFLANYLFMVNYVLVVSSEEHGRNVS
jgi:hypothetical protein